MCSLQIWLLSLNIFLHVVSVSDYLKLLINNPLYEYTTICLFILLLIDIWNVSSFAVVLKTGVDNPYKGIGGVCYILCWVNTWEWNCWVRRYLHI